MIVDLSHVFHEGMPGVRFKSETGETVELTAHIRPYMTHAQSWRHYDGKASFEISDVAFQSSVGTKMDAPRHRFEGADDVASIELNRLVLEGVVIDARHARPAQQVGWTDLQFPTHLAGRAVLVNFGWDRHWGTETYRSHPYVSREVVTRLCEAGVALFGVDCSNVDSTQDAERPAHTRFLRQRILIVENLTGLARLHGQSFRFFFHTAEGTRRGSFSGTCLRRSARIDAATNALLSRTPPSSADMVEYAPTVPPNHSLNRTTRRRRLRAVRSRPVTLVR